MATDEEIARDSIDFQKRAKDVPLTQIPGFMEWSNRKLSEGVSPDLIAHLDAVAICLLPEEISTIDESNFEEMLQDIEAEMEE